MLRKKGDSHESMAGVQLVLPESVVDKLQRYSENERIDTDRRTKPIASLCLLTRSIVIASVNPVVTGVRFVLSESHVYKLQRCSGN